MSRSFDLVVLGAGMAAVAAAGKCASAGWSVAIVDELPYGGTCALRGCDPKKILRRGAEIVDAARLLQGRGIEEGGLSINWADLVAFKHEFTDRIPGRIEKGLTDKGVTTLHGSARFVAPNAVEVGGERIEGRYILIATGARPRPIDVPGGACLVDSTEFMELDALPPRILFVGAGFISFEFAHLAARAGSQVTIIDRGSRPLDPFDPDLVDRLVDHSAALGIGIHLHTELKSIDKTPEGYVVAGVTEGKERRWSADLVVHGAGRVAAIDDLDLQAAGVERGGRGVCVNEHLQSVSNPAVYAAGDAAETAGPPLTPVAVFEGKVAASNMLKGNHAVPDYRSVPSVVFTIPELARVGMLETEARATGRDVRVTFTDTSGWYSNLRVGATCAAAKVLVDGQTDEILGAHLLGPEYAELINFFGLAIKLRLTAADLRSMTAAYPTVGSDLGSLF
ncbi:dihydrolipoyl dehydrogenase family protein [Brevundimonas sp.]|uniref:dihydrolipoyl dehydrogenase family protein n=1 Tax=Brevundimonas sp. TaxID=1871086 RepID=UPI003F6FD53C